MGPIAARHARTVLEHVERIVAIELLVGAEALDQRLELIAADGTSGGATGDATEPVVAGAGVAAAHERIRADVARQGADREPGPDLAALTRRVHDGELVRLVSDR